MIDSTQNLVLVALVVIERILDKNIHFYFYLFLGIRSPCINDDPFMMAVVDRGAQVKGNDFPCLI